jgi:hypothetical protein
MTYQKLAYLLNKVEPGLYRKYKVNTAKEKIPMLRDITKYNYAHVIICTAFEWSSATLFPDLFTWPQVYTILFREEYKGEIL